MPFSMLHSMADATVDGKVIENPVTKCLRKILLGLAVGGLFCSLSGAYFLT